MTVRINRTIVQLVAIALMVGLALTPCVAPAGQGNCQDPGCKGSQCPTCNGCCSMCGKQKCQLVPCTVMKPVTVTETRVKNCVVRKQVERKETYTVFHRKAESREFKKEICYLDDEIKTLEITQERCKVVNNPVIQTYRVKVPVCEEYTEMVQREQCIDGQMVLVEEPCTRSVIREQEEVRTRDCEQPQVVFLENTCTIDYCVKTPKTRELPCSEETVYKLEPETRERTVMACVPEIERRTYDVQVTKLYPKTVCVCQHCAAKLSKKQSSDNKDGLLKDGLLKGGLGKLKELCKH